MASIFMLWQKRGLAPFLYGILRSGAGETLSCGSGAIAAVFDGQQNRGMENSVTVGFKKDTVEVQKTPHGYASSEAVTLYSRER